MRKLGFIAPLFLFGFVFACSGGDDETPVATATVGTDIEATPPLAETQQPPASPTQVSGLPSSVRLQRVFPNLGFARFTGLYQMPDGRWLATEQPGRVMLIDGGGQAGVFLDLRNRVNSQGNEEGLLGLALAPDFAQSRVFYIYYSVANPRRSVISRFVADPAATSAPAASETILMEVAQPFSNHNGGQIAFGPDGYLYVALGDGGSGNDPDNNGQNLATLLGSLLRIDVSGGGQGYTVPPDNPFVARQGARGEIWAYGLRNPWRFSFDRVTGDLWLGDVGQNAREEVDIITKGGNYGWRIMEGAQCRGGGSNCNMTGLEPPIVDYATAGGNCSVTGGFVYRGSEIGALQGAYVYADYCSGRIWALRTEGFVRSEHEEIADAGFRISSFAQDNDGELYVLEHANEGGGIYKLVE